jgi:F0F1-type ATP synthase alpha subunit
LDDLTIHAKYYRELSLLSKKFPGRSSYPGDIFYLHARILERAGNFKKGSITCLPVAETVFGDISGYIQTNLMSMTDGHILFDRELYNQGRRPPVNPFLSVTRVGHQTQSHVSRDLSRELTSFLVKYEKMKQLMHFGGEVNQATQKILEKGQRIIALFDQSAQMVMPPIMGQIIFAGIWIDVWQKENLFELKKLFGDMVALYQKDKGYKDKLNALLLNSNSFNEFLDKIRSDKAIFKTKT